MKGGVLNTPPMFYFAENEMLKNKLPIIKRLYNDLIFQVELCLV